VSASLAEIGDAGEKVEDRGFSTKVRWRKLGVSWRNTAELAEQYAEELSRNIKDGLDSRR
jgi:hypothetical protein